MIFSNNTPLLNKQTREPKVTPEVTGVDVDIELRKCVDSLVERYFAGNDNSQKGNLYESMVRSLEYPLLKSVLVRSRGNQSQAARILGINRGTLRKHLKYHKLD